MPYPLTLSPDDGAVSGKSGFRRKDRCSERCIAMNLGDQLK
jgi:hypothetical protein